MPRSLTRHAVATRHGGDRHAGYLVYHQTTVVAWDPEQIRLDTGGWRTVTSKARMNQAAEEYDLGFRVFAERGTWYVCQRNPQTGLIDWSKRIPFVERTLTLLRGPIHA